MNFLLAHQAIVNHMWEYSGKASIHADYVHVILIPFDKTIEIFTHINWHAHIYIIYINIYLHIYACIYIYIYIHAYMYACISIYCPFLSYYDILSSLVGWHRNLASCCLLQDLPPDGAVAAPAEDVSQKAWNFQRV